LTKFNAIVIGLGRIGLHYGFDLKRKQPASHISAIMENKNLDLIGVCDSDKKSQDLFIEKYGNVVPVFDDYSNLFERLSRKEIECEIVVIATPESTHKKILESLLKSLENTTKSVIIFCEKPLAENLVSAKEIEQMLKNPNLKIVVNHSRRWSNIWKEAYRLSKDIGEIKKGSFYFSTSPENEEINQIRDGVHIADLIAWFNITGKTTINRLSVPYFIYDFYLWGTDGKIEILNFGEKLNFYKVNTSSRFENFSELELIHTKTVEESLLSNAYNEFVAFLNGKINSLSTNFDDAVLALDVFEKYVYDDKLAI